MNDKQQPMIGEIAVWALEYQAIDPDQYNRLITELGEAKGQYIAAESAYVMRHRRGPEWALYIGSFWIKDGTDFVFIERDNGGLKS